jgi:single-stranded DNA-binding protein
VSGHTKNHVELEGWLGSDAKVFYDGSNPGVILQVTTCEQPPWAYHVVRWWGKAAEAQAADLVSGRRVLIIARLRPLVMDHRSKRVSVSEVIASKVALLDGPAAPVRRA